MPMTTSYESSTPITIPASQSKRRPQNPIDLGKIGVHWIL